LEKPMKIEDAIKAVCTQPLVPLWPEAATLLSLSRSGIYDAVARGEVDTVRIGRHLKAISSSLRKKVKLEAIK
jgi:hypothetical protein